MAKTDNGLPVRQPGQKLPEDKGQRPRDVVLVLRPGPAPKKR